MFLTQNIISHRGIHDNKKVYENSLQAIKKARDKGYIVEIDIHLTKDNKIVVFHDYNTKRITGKNLIIEDSTYKELNNQNILHIPLLEEVLELVDKKVPLLIEIKQLNKVGQLENTLMDILKNYQGKYAIQSFNPKVLYWFKKNYPNIIRGQLSYQYNNKNIPKIEKFILKNMLFNFITKPNFISYKYNELSLDKILKYKKKYIILGWTVQKETEYNKYIKYYDNLICENFINAK